MITQQFDLNMIPDSAPVIVHVDQYDIGAGRLVAALYDGDQPYTPHSAATVQIQGTKSDGHSFLYDAAISGNVVTADLTEQMTAAAGDARVQLVVREYTGRTGSFAFILRIQRSALPADSDMSESDLSAIEELIEEADGIVEEASGLAEDAEAWAQGTRGGDPVGPTDPTYEHNAAYWAAYAEQYAEGALHYKGSIAFANIPITGMVSGDMYNITNDFVTDSRFEEGAGHHVKGGTNVAYTDNDKWDILALPMIPTMTASTQGIGRPDGMTADVTQGVFRAKGVAISCTINPSGTEHGANWLMYGGVVVTPDAVQLYKVYIDGKPTLWTWDVTEHEYAKVSADGGGSASDLDDLGDVDISNPHDREALIYDAATGKWVNGAGGGGHTIIDDEGTDYPQRTYLQFEGATITDDSENDTTVVETGGGTPQSMIGDAWVLNHAYAVGNYCIDGNVLYKCKTAHTSTASNRPPYASYWDATTVASQLGGSGGGTGHSEIYKVGSNTVPSGNRLSKTYTLNNIDVLSYKYILIGVSGNAFLPLIDIAVANAVLNGNTITEDRYYAWNYGGSVGGGITDIGSHKISIDIYQTSGSTVNVYLIK